MFQMPRFSQRDLKSHLKSIFLLLSILKDMVSISEKGRRLSMGSLEGQRMRMWWLGWLFSIPSSSWQLSGEGFNAGCGEQDF